MFKMLSLILVFTSSSAYSLDMLCHGVDSEYSVGTMDQPESLNRTTRYFTLSAKKLETVHPEVVVMMRKVVQIDHQLQSVMRPIFHAHPALENYRVRELPHPSENTQLKVGSMFWISYNVKLLVDFARSKESFISQDVRIPVPGEHLADLDLECVSFE